MLKEFIQQFLNYISFEKRYSVNTSNSYKKDLNQFSDFLDTTFKPLNLEGIDHNMIRSWVISLMDDDYAPTSVNRKISTLKAFFKHLLKENKILKNPSSKIKPIKTPKKLPQFIESKKINFLLDQTYDKDDYNSILEILIIEFFYGTGIRLSELLNIKNSDVDLHKKEVIVLGKGNKQRIIPLNSTLLQLIADFNSKKEKGNNNTIPFFLVNNKNIQVSKSYVYRTVKKKLNEIDTQTKASPHILRHTFATHLLNQGADLNSIKELLGHSSLASTQVYTHNDLDKLKSAFRKAHPKA